MWHEETSDGSHSELRDRDLRDGDWSSEIDNEEQEQEREEEQKHAQNEEAKEEEEEKEEVPRIPSDVVCIIMGLRNTVRAYSYLTEEQYSEFAQPP